MGKHWLDKHIKEQKKNRNILGKHFPKLQEMADREKWESRHEFKISKYKHMDYCANCRKRTEHIKYARVKMCKCCGYMEKY